HDLWNDIRKEIGKGKQAFVITPLIAESESIDAASVEETYTSLKSHALSGVRVAYVHGKMKSDDSKRIMDDFRNQKYDVLVASTVVEVGVDIQNATRMIILSADRLGASTLHQIRGRI